MHRTGDHTGGAKQVAKQHVVAAFEIPAKRTVYE